MVNIITSFYWCKDLCPHPWRELLYDCNVTTSYSNQHHLSLRVIVSCKTHLPVGRLPKSYWCDILRQYINNSHGHEETQSRMLITRLLILLKHTLVAYFFLRNNINMLLERREKAKPDQTEQLFVLRVVRFDKVEPKPARGTSIRLQPVDVG